jgi:hypothetical protein
MIHPAHPLQSVLDALNTSHRNMQCLIDSRYMQFIPENYYQDIQSVNDAIATVRAIMDVKIEKIPTYEECKKAINNGTNETIYNFIHEHEPADSCAEKIFRKDLQNIINDAYAAGLAASKLSNGASSPMNKVWLVCTPHDKILYPDIDGVYSTEELAINSMIYDRQAIALVDINKLIPLKAEDCEIFYFPCLEKWEESATCKIQQIKTKERKTDV